MAVGGGWKRPTVVNAVADFEPDGIAIENEPSHLAPEQRDEFAVIGEVLLGAVDRGAEGALEPLGDFEEIPRITARNEGRDRTKELFKQGRVGEEPLLGGGKEVGGGLAPRRSGDRLAARPGALDSSPRPAAEAAARLTR
jgi:hypothetical protein